MIGTNDWGTNDWGQIFPLDKWEESAERIGQSAESRWPRWNRKARAFHWVNRWRRTDDRGQKSEVRGQRSDVREWRYWLLV